MSPALDCPLAPIGASTSATATPMSLSLRRRRRRWNEQESRSRRRLPGSAFAQIQALGHLVAAPTAIAGAGRPGARRRIGLDREAQAAGRCGEQASRSCRNGDLRMQRPRSARQFGSSGFGELWC
jgi:hypothetical protein